MTVREQIVDIVKGLAIEIEDGRFTGIDGFVKIVDNPDIATEISKEIIAKKEGVEQFRVRLTLSKGDCEGDVEDDYDDEDTWFSDAD